MITFKHEFIRDVLPMIGSDAFTVFTAIASHAGRGKVVWPGIDRLRNICTVETKGKLKKMPEKRIYKAINVLISNGLAERFQERKNNGDFGLRKFKICSDLVGVTFFGEHEFVLEENSRLVKNGEARNGEAINDQTEELPKKEGNDQIKDVDPVTPDWEERFCVFWDRFSRKIGKKKARTAFKNLTKSKQLACMDEETINQYDQYLAITGYDKCHPTSWINGERWDDDFTVQEKATGANTDEALNDKLLPEPLNTEYQRYIAYIIDTFPALWKSKCQVLSKSQWYELTQTEVFPGLRIAMTNRKAKDIRAKMHHLFNENNFERAKYGTIYDAIITEYRRHINHEKTLIA